MKRSEIIVGQDYGWTTKPAWPVRKVTAVAVGNRHATVRTEDGHERDVSIMQIKCRWDVAERYEQDKLDSAQLTEMAEGLNLAELVYARWVFRFYGETMIKDMPYVTGLESQLLGLWEEAGIETPVTDEPGTFKDYLGRLNISAEAAIKLAKALVARAKPEDVTLAIDKHLLRIRYTLTGERYYSGYSNVTVADWSLAWQIGDGIHDWLGEEHSELFYQDAPPRGHFEPTYGRHLKFIPDDPSQVEEEIEDLLGPDPDYDEPDHDEPPAPRTKASPKTAEKTALALDAALGALVRLGHAEEANRISTMLSS